MSKRSDAIRIDWAANDAKRDAGLTTPENIIRTDDIRYGDDAENNLLDVYRLKTASGKSPVIVIVHGGGWVYGDKELYQYYGMSLAQRGFTVVNYTYRLAPEAKFPASLEDTANVVRWMYENADRYEFDMANVCMAGDSAGGDLLGLFCALCTDTGYASNFDFTAPEGFVPRAVAMNCGDYTPDDDGIENGDTKELIDDLMPGSGKYSDRSLINVVRHVNRNYPPAYIMSAQGDFLLSQAAVLESAYKKAGVYCECKIYGDKDEPLYHVFHVTVQEPQGQMCNDEECGFFWRMIAEAKK